jgi:IMP cyclohydrolase
MAGLEAIADKEYLGRMFIIGRDGSGENNVIVYAATGRSPPSRARLLREESDGSIKMHPSKDAPKDEGNPALLFYNAIKQFDNTFVVSNGAQTDMVMPFVQMWGSIHSALLGDAFSEPHLVKGSKGESIDLASFEPDHPNYTPRITGVVNPQDAVAHIIREQEGKPIQDLFDIPLKNGNGMMLATYSGKNVPKGVRIPSFVGDPVQVELVENSAKDLAEHVYAALGPKSGPDIVTPGGDFRVSVAAVFYDLSSGKATTHIVNRHEE